jgi:hypothetical protein
MNDKLFNELLDSVREMKAIMRGEATPGRMFQVEPSRKNVHPTQPAALDEHGVLRFKSNAIIKHLFDTGALDLNALAKMPFSIEDRAQIAQLLGYSISGYMDLSYIVGELYLQADAIQSQYEDADDGPGA